MRPWAPAALAALLLAGCSDPADPATGPGPAAGDAHAGHDAAMHVLAPQWQVGQWWALESPQGGPFTHAVSGESGDDWTVDTDSRDIAYFDARFDISFLGKVRKSDLAGSQGSTRVEFLRFPLQAHLNWTTTWDGEPMAVHVARVEGGWAELEARRADGTRYADYSYDSKAGYFARFAFYDPGGETVGFEWSLKQSGLGFSSPLVRMAVEELYGTSGPFPPQASGTFTVQPGLTDVWVEAAIACTQGAFNVAAGPLTGPVEDRGYSAASACPLAEAVAYPVTAPAQAEQWGFTIASAPAATQGTLDLHLWGRTVTEFQAGQAPA